MTNTPTLSAPAAQADRAATRARRPDYKDLAIETLADSEAALLERVVTLEVDVAAHRSVMRATVHALHCVTGQRDRLRARLRTLLDRTTARA